MTATLFTIGFTQSSAEHFFGRLQQAGVRTVIDVRLHTDSQLAGFAKARDLAWFLGTLGGIGYRHEPLLAPTEAIFKLGQAKDWPRWESGYRDLLVERRVADLLKPADIDGACLLCSETTPHRCHRRLVAEHLGERWRRKFTVTHL